MKFGAGLWTYVRNGVVFQLVAVPVCISVFLLIEVTSGEFPSPHTPFRVWLTSSFKILSIYGITGGLALSVLHTWVLSRVSLSSRVAAVRYSWVLAGTLAAVQGIPLSGVMVSGAPFILLIPGALVYGLVVARLHVRVSGGAEVPQAVPIRPKTDARTYVRNGFLFQLVGIPICTVLLFLIDGYMPGRAFITPFLPLGERILSAIQISSLYGITAGLGLSLLHTWLLSRLSVPSRGILIRQSVVCAAGLGALQAIPLFFVPSVTPFPVMVSAALAYGWAAGYLQAK